MSKWTDVAPTVPGWYWCKQCYVVRGGPTMPVEIYLGGENEDVLGTFSERADEFISVKEIGNGWSSEPILMPD